MKVCIMMALERHHGKWSILDLYREKNLLSTADLIRTLVEDYRLGTHQAICVINRTRMEMGLPQLHLSDVQWHLSHLDKINGSYLEGTDERSKSFPVPGKKDEKIAFSG